MRIDIEDAPDQVFGAFWDELCEAFPTRVIWTPDERVSSNSVDLFMNCRVDDVKAKITQSLNCII